MEFQDSLKRLVFKRHSLPVTFVALLATLLLCVFLLTRLGTNSDALVIGVIANSGDNPKTYEAIKFFVQKRSEVINDKNGINGRNIEVVVKNNHGNKDKAKEHVQEFVANENLIGLIGIWNSSRAAHVMPLIEQADVPLIGYFSDTNIYRNLDEDYVYRHADGTCENTDNSGNCLSRKKDHPGIYTGIISLNDELRAFRRRLLKTKVRSVMYIGQEYDRYSSEYLNGLVDMKCRSQDEEQRVFLLDHLHVFTVSTKSGSGELKEWRILCNDTAEGERFSVNSVDFESNRRISLLTSLLEKKLPEFSPDMLLLSLGSVENKDLVKALPGKSEGLIVYSALGDIGNIIGLLDEESADGNANNSMHEGIELWDTADQGIPHANNQRLEELYYKHHDELQKREVDKNIIGFGGIYSDLVAMLVESANTGKSTNPLEVREIITEGMKAYRKGGKIFQGWAQDWWFTADRSASRDSRFAWSPSGRSTYVLDPIQFIFSNGEPVWAEVLYTSIDVIEFRGIDDEDGEVDVEFYLGLKKAQKSDRGLLADSVGGCGKSKDDHSELIRVVSFPNAAKSKVDQSPLIDYRRLKRGTEKSDGFEFCSELYQVSGRFAFHPLLRKYPFDQQTIQISIQASDNNRPILIQPLASELQDKDFRSPNWVPVQHYVGVDQDIIKSLTGYGENVEVIPFYKFNFTWIMQREVVEYQLKVIIPVLILCLVTYTSIFIPKEYFEAEAGIQVTCLLAAIALYFSIDKPGTPYATLSDWVFVATYLTIMSMMVLSVTRAVIVARNLKGLNVVVPLQIVGYPIWVLVVVAFLYNLMAASL